MIDPILSLATSLHSNKGVYALLLGSGVSRSAGIPTGWEVMLDLIRQIARLQGKECDPDPNVWFEREFGAQPTYSNLIAALAKTPAERSRMMKRYFEPDEAEREEGRKLPTAAHKAIAELVQGGYVRVIVTTNFDRLLERALEQAGITPTVLSTPDAAEGAYPLAHTQSCILKVHGDYIDPRTLNTGEELASYDPRIERLLHQVFDEYGLIVCGWSGEWDTALRNALERCKSHRFTTYWTTRSEPSETAKRLIQLRRAQLIGIEKADSFFPELLEKLKALAELARPHPLSARIAVQTLKRYLSDERFKIQVRDFVTAEAEKVCERIDGQNFPVDNLPADELVKRVGRYESAVEVLSGLMAVGCYWAEGRYNPLWKTTLEYIANRNLLQSGLTWFINLQQFPTLVLLYCAGISSVAAQRYDTLKALLVDAKIRNRYEEEPLVYSVNVWSVMNKQAGWRLPEMDKHRTPLSDYLYGQLRERLKDVILADTEYDRIFDRLEYFIAAVYLDLKTRADIAVHMPPIGRFGWKMTRGTPNVDTSLEEECQKHGDQWKPPQAGMFEGKPDRFREVQEELRRYILQLRWY